MAKFQFEIENRLRTLSLTIDDDQLRRRIGTRENAIKRAMREMDRQLCKLFYFNGYRVIDTRKIERELTATTESNSGAAEYILAVIYDIRIQLRCDARVCLCV